MDPVIITPDDVAEAVRRAPNWKSPGLDGLHHYWLKGFVVCHAVLARQFQEALDQKSLPSLFTTGITHLVPKDRDSTNLSKYRPITCLPTIYKTLTSILSARITRHLNSNQVMSRAQNGCRGGGRGTKEPLLIDAVIGKVVKRNRRNLSAAWIDYKKAFDSVPHTWLKRVLELYKVDCTVRDFLGQCMEQWSTILCHLGERMTAAENHIRIRRSIFQGDCLSPIWFCLSLNPLSTLLEGSGRGFQLRRGGTKVTHLFYMDDLKLFASSRSHLMELLNITCDFSNSIRMELGTDKCAILHVEGGRVANSEGIDLSMPMSIRTLSEAQTYRYLGMSQNMGIDESNMKRSVCGVFYARLTKVLNSLLSGVNKTHAYNGWIMPVLMYTFGMLRWTQTELNALDRKVRTIMTSHRMHHPRSSVMRLYLPRKHELSEKENKTNPLLENIRRQLMKDNYDYGAEETTVVLRSKMEEYQNKEYNDNEKTSTLFQGNISSTLDIPDKVESTAKTYDHAIVNITTSQTIDARREPEMYDNQSKYITKTEKSNTESQTSKNDGNMNTQIKRRVGANNIQYENGDTDVTASNARVRYNILKVRSPNRRSKFQQSQLVMEEKDNEVSIVNFGKGPVPEFRLPQSHRQYMLDETDSDLSYFLENSNSTTVDSAIDLDK
ncbi:unnamed protein product [Parnassius mnemosyne]|uniref:Reverse transcriptase domain-containing protein n=1 Tax=Parnassius mnemosyne TaxID=213953 RepID=A0AAV1LJD3_9NEOP